MSLDGSIEPIQMLRENGRDDVGRTLRPPPYTPNAAPSIRSNQRCGSSRFNGSTMR